MRPGRCGGAPQRPGGTTATHPLATRALKRAPSARIRHAGTKAPPTAPSARLPLLGGRVTEEATGVLYNVVNMDQAIASGRSRRQVYRLVERGEWLRLSEGVFLTARVAPENERLRWKTDLAGLLLRLRGGGMVSHRAAAILHGMEGVSGHPLEASIPASAHRAPPGVQRTKFADPSPVLIDGLLTTSVARTLRDLGARCPADVVEQALESMLRGADRKRPDVWNEKLLAELRASVTEHERQPGTFVLRTVLARRSDSDRPTGSYPETLLFQSLRAIGVGSVRQPTLRIAATAPPWKTVSRHRRPDLRRAGRSRWRRGALRSCGAGTRSPPPEQVAVSVSPLPLPGEHDSRRRHERGCRHQAATPARVCDRSVVAEGRCHRQLHDE